MTPVIGQGSKAPLRPLEGTAERTVEGRSRGPIKPVRAFFLLPKRA